MTGFEIPLWVACVLGLLSVGGFMFMLKMQDRYIEKLKGE